MEGNKAVWISISHQPCNASLLEGMDIGGQDWGEMDWDAGLPMWVLHCFWQLHVVFLYWFYLAACSWKQRIMDGPAASHA
jgi:hypothetical protein